ncbi:MAG: hypothetical protein ACRD2C_14610 [Acidimicrobiales bacterium]
MARASSWTSSTLVGHSPEGTFRHYVDDAERARTAVRKAIKRVIDAVADTDPTLAEHLAATVHTGAKCIYLPDVHRPITWTTHTPVLGTTVRIDGPQRTVAHMTEREQL